MEFEPGLPSIPVASSEAQRRRQTKIINAFCVLMGLVLLAAVAVLSGTFWGTGTAVAMITVASVGAFTLQCLTGWLRLRPSDVVLSIVASFQLWVIYLLVSL